MSSISNPVVVSFNLSDTMVAVEYSGKIYHIKCSRQCFVECRWDFGDRYFREKVDEHFLPTLRFPENTPAGFEKFLIWAAEYGHIL